jgi:hypothetical protein
MRFLTALLALALASPALAQSKNEKWVATWATALVSRPLAAPAPAARRWPRRSCSRRAEPLRRQRSRRHQRHPRLRPPVAGADAASCRRRR